MLIKILLEFTRYFKVQNVIKKNSRLRQTYAEMLAMQAIENRIHFNTS